MREPSDRDDLRERSSAETPAPSPWADALRVATLLASDPHGLGGVLVRAGAGPVRERWLDHLRAALRPGTPWRRMPAGIADDRLIGGLDLTATLAAGRPVAQAGLLAEADGGLVVVPMAERLPPATIGRLCAALDTGVVALERDGLAGRLPARFGLVLLDEGGAEETVADALADRLAFRIDLDGLGLRDAADGAAHAGDGATEAVDACAALTAVAAELGVASLRGPLLAARAARRAAETDGRVVTSVGDVVEAARLVLAPRATRLPAAEETAEAPRPDPPPEPADESDDAPERPEDRPLDEVVLEAARAAIPAHLLAEILAGGLARAARAGRAGAPGANGRSGRPVGSRPGDPRRDRLDLVGTLRAAAPWQRLRGAPPGRLAVRADDLRVRRFRPRTETTALFCVDASGSAARERLAEAKGAVETLLAEAYVRRDRVALIAFRGAGAQVLLPPTRSLVRAKRCLAGLPGGGGTPLAAGLDAAALLALAVRRGGGRPVIVLLTDGRANVARSGEGGRARAGAEAIEAARALRVHGLPTLVVDTGARPEGARALSEAAGARYCPMPQAGAPALGSAVRAAMAP